MLTQLGLILGLIASTLAIIDYSMKVVKAIRGFRKTQKPRRAL